MNTPPLTESAKPRASRAWRLGLAALVLFAALIRLGIIGTHFTHIDDVGVAGAIIAASDPIRVTALFQEKLLAAAAQTGSPRARLLERLTASRAWRSAAPLATGLYRFVCVPAEWTYAPAQFVLTALLVRPSQPYRTALVAGRLPSLLAGLAGLLLTVLAFRWCSGSEPACSGAALVAGAIIACSLEHLLYSLHMSNYALGVAATATLVILLHRSFLPAARPYRRALVHGAALTGLFLCQYQLLPLAAAFLATRFLWEWRATRIGFWRAGLVTAIPGAMFAMVFLPIFLFRLSDMTTAHWNAGPSGEFAFSPPGSGLPALVSYAVPFFVRNGFLAFGSLVSFLPEDSTAFVPVAAALLLLALLGLAAWLRSSDRAARYFCFFLLISAGLWSVMIVSGKMMLAPTRHNLVLLPLAALAISRGLIVIGRRRPSAVSIGAIVVMAASLMLSLPAFLAGRNDPFSEDHLAELVRKNRAETVIYTDTSHNLMLMPSLRKTPMQGIAAAAQDESLPGRRVLIISRADLSHPDSAGWDNGAMLDDLRRVLSGRRIEWREDSASDVEFEFSRRTRNGANTLHILALGACPAKPVP